MSNFLKNTFIFSLLIFTNNLLAQKSANWRIAESDTIEAEFNGWAFNSVFNVPVIRYNVNTLDGKSNPPGNMEYFNSLGAGISVSFGRINIRSKNNASLRTTLDGDKSITMKNVFGISAGVLFSKNDSVGGNRLIFAPTINLQVLDFQIGWGYELGTVANNAHRTIFTVSYGIPLSKFTDSGSYLIRRTLRTANSGTLDVKGFF